MLLANITSEATDKNGYIIKVSTCNKSEEKLDNGDYAQRYGYYVMSYDVLWENLETPSEQFLIQEMIFNTKSYWNHMRFYMNTDGTFTFVSCNTGLKDDNGVYQPGKGSTYARGLKLNDGEWHTVTIILDKRGFDSTLSILVDGLCVADCIPSYYSTINADYNEVINSVTFRQKRGDYNVYLDNVTLEYMGEESPFTK